MTRQKKVRKKVKALNGSNMYNQLSCIKNINCLLTKETIKDIKYKNIKIEINKTSISFYCIKNKNVFYSFVFYRKLNSTDKELDLYRALIDFDEKILSDILDPILIPKSLQYDLIYLSNQVNDIIKYMVI